MLIVGEIFDLNQHDTLLKIGVSKSVKEFQDKMDRLQEEISGLEQDLSKLTAEAPGYVAIYEKLRRLKNKRERWKKQIDISPERTKEDLAREGYLVVEDGDRWLVGQVIDYEETETPFGKQFGYCDELNHEIKIATTRFRRQFGVTPHLFVIDA